MLLLLPDCGLLRGLGGIRPPLLALGDNDVGPVCCCIGLPALPLPLLLVVVPVILLLVLLVSVPLGSTSLLLLALAVDATWKQQQQ
jgi:hypothetical protein